MRRLDYRVFLILFIAISVLRTQLIYKQHIEYTSKELLTSISSSQSQFTTSLSQLPLFPKDRIHQDSQKLLQITEENRNSSEVASVRSIQTIVHSMILFPVSFPDQANETSFQQILAKLDLINTYFSNISWGRVQWNFTLFDQWINLPRQVGYYGEGDPDTTDDRRLKELAEDTITYVDPLVDFQVYDFITIVYAGDAGTGDNLWSVTYFDRISTDEKLFNSIGFLPENEWYGTWCHEFAHLLGAPDLYDYDYEEDNWTHSFDLMSLGSYQNPPVSLSAWMKQYLGFLNDSQVRTLNEGANSSFIINPLQMNASNLFVQIMVRDDLDYDFDYFGLEVRSKIGYDQAIPDEGLLLTKCFDSPIQWTPQSLDEKYPNYRIIRAGFSWASACFNAGDTYYDNLSGLSINVNQEFLNKSLQVTIFYPEVHAPIIGTPQFINGYPSPQYHVEIGSLITDYHTFIEEAWVIYSMDGGENIRINMTNVEDLYYFSIPTASEGTVVNYTIYAKDRDENIAARSFSYVIDSTAPIASFLIANGTIFYEGTPVTLTWSASDDSSGLASFNLTLYRDDEVTPYYFVYSLSKFNRTIYNLEPGSYTAVLIAYDVAGYSTTTGLTFIISKSHVSSSTSLTSIISTTSSKDKVFFAPFWFILLILLILQLLRQFRRSN